MDKASRTFENYREMVLETHEKGNADFLVGENIDSAFRAASLDSVG